jgi:hypothetical protein
MDGLGRATRLRGGPGDAPAAALPAAVTGDAYSRSGGPWAATGRPYLDLAEA